MIGFLLNFPKFSENTRARISEDTDLYFILHTYSCLIAEIINTSSSILHV